MSGSVSAETANAEVTAAYLAELGRQPDAAGLAAYSALLTAGAPLSQVQGSLAQSAEAQADIAALYTATLGRAVDPGAAALLTQGLSAGSSLAQFRALLVASPEGRGAIDRQYRAILGRPADSAGLALNAQVLEAGGSLGQVAASLAASPEAARLIAQTFQNDLGRSATAADIAAYTAALPSVGYSAERQSIAFSAESTQTIQTLYRQYLGRAATASEVTSFQADLLSGDTVASRTTTLDAEHRLLISTVPDQTAALTASYESVFGFAPTDTRIPEPSVIPILQDELALGRPIADVEQVTDYQYTNGSATTDTYGYIVPAQYSDDGFTLFEMQGSPVPAPSAPVVPLPVSGATGATGPDTITLTLSQVLTSPLTFSASLDGQPVGQATLPASPSFGAPSFGQVSFTGNFASANQLDLTFAAIPLNGLTVRSGTYDGHAFVLGAAANGSATTLSLFPHASSSSVVTTSTSPFQ